MYVYMIYTSIIYFLLTSVPVTSCCEVRLLSDGPSKASSIPEDVPVLGQVFEDWPLWRPVHPVGGDFVTAVTVGISGTQHVESWTDDVRQLGVLKKQNG